MEKVELGRTRTAHDECRRYRPLNYSFDTRARILLTVTDNFDAEIAEQWESNKRHIREGLIAEFGVVDFEQKIEDFTALEASPFSVVALHNLFLQHARVSFISGAYYASLVASGALGERILNQLVINLRGDYSDHPATTNTIATRQSFQNWPPVVKVLEQWGVIDHDTRSKFLQLNQLRNSASHYDPLLDGSNARDEALEAAQLIQAIVSTIFTPLGMPPRFIANTPGMGFISREAEAEPLVKHFYLPACALVSPVHRIAGSMNEAFDDETYQQHYAELSDAEFAQHVVQSHSP